MGLKVGVTGGIGSGKTTVCRIFSILGVPVFSADETARIIMDSDTEVEKKINDVAGRNMYTGSGLDRKGLASLIFNNRDLLEKINNIVHPLVREKFESWAAGVDTEYVIYEAAILFESGHYKEMDRVICVTAPEELRIRRVMERDHLTREQVEKRMASQWDEKKKIALADFVIMNDERQLLIPQVLEIHKKLGGET